MNNKISEINLYYDTKIEELSRKILVLSNQLDTLRQEERSLIRIRHHPYYLLLSMMMTREIANIILVYLHEHYCSKHESYFGNNCIKCTDQSQWILRKDVLVQYKPCNLYFLDEDDRKALSYWSDLKSIVVYDHNWNILPLNYPFVISAGTRVYYTNNRHYIILDKEKLLKCSDIDLIYHFYRALNYLYI